MCLKDYVIITNAKLRGIRSSYINDTIMDGYSLVYLRTSFFVIIPRRRPLWVTRVWKEFFTDYDMKASHISWYQSILQPPTWRRPSLRNMSTTVSMGVWKGSHWYKFLVAKLQGVFLTAPPPKLSKCWNHIHFARHLGVFRSEGGPVWDSNVFLKSVTYRPTLSKFRGGPVKKNTL